MTIESTATIESLESSGRLSGTHPAREAFAGCSGIYDRVTEGLSAFNDVLQGWGGFYLDREGLMGFNIWSSGTRLRIYDEYGRKFGCAYFEWQWVVDGWEVLGRIGKHAA